MPSQCVNELALARITRSTTELHCHESYNVFVSAQTKKPDILVT
jgi:hypothetical protein